MKKIKLKSMRLENFKGCKKRTIDFGEVTNISGQNASGKTTIFDGFTWLLFGKDSLGSTKFDVRPLEYGKMVNNIDICVEAAIEVDGVDYSLKKTQKQKWVKKRGADTKEFQGNVNDFEINGYPKSEKEFKEFIGSIIDEKLFNLVTNPSAFASLNWRDQREILMKFVSGVDDKELAEENEFKALVPELAVATTDDIRKKYTKAKNELNKQMVQIPARIDEISKQLSCVDIAELESQKATLKCQLQDVEDELSGLNGKAEEIGNRRKEIMQLKFDMSTIAQKASEGLNKKKHDAFEEVSIAVYAVKDAELEVTRVGNELARTKKNLEDAKFEKGVKTSEWRREKSCQFQEYEELAPLSEDSFICPTCGRDLPEEKKDQIISEYKEKCKKHRSDWEKKKSEFEAKHQANLKEITEAGKKLSDSIKKYEAEISDLEKDLNEKKKIVVEKREIHSKAKSMYDDLNAQEVVYPNAYMDMMNKISQLEAEIKVLEEADTGKIETEAKKRVICDMISEIDVKIAKADNSQVKARIAELEKEQKDVGYKVAKTEQMLQMVEDFVRLKMDKISQSVNKMFDKVSFKLFDNQINGGVSETCECTYNGVPYSSLNNGHRIISGLDIIHSLAVLYDVNCPVFIDNAEALSEGNLPEIGCQMILLNVSNDSELKVEVER
jgi:hypothetical protein